MAALLELLMVGRLRPGVGQLGRSRSTTAPDGSYSVLVEQRRLGDDCSAWVAVDLPSGDFVVAGRLAVGVTEVLL
jgi:hypothetical protein